MSAREKFADWRMGILSRRGGARSYALSEADNRSSSARAHSSCTQRSGCCSSLSRWRRQARGKEAAREKCEITSKELADYLREEGLRRLGVIGSFHERGSRIETERGFRLLVPFLGPARSGNRNRAVRSFLLVVSLGEEARDNAPFPGLARELRQKAGPSKTSLRYYSHS